MPNRAVPPPTHSATSVYPPAFLIMDWGGKAVGMRHRVLSSFLSLKKLVQSEATVMLGWLPSSGSKEARKYNGGLPFSGVKVSSTESRETPPFAAAERETMLCVLQLSGSTAVPLSEASSGKVSIIPHCLLLPLRERPPLHFLWAQGSTAVAEEGGGVGGVQACYR